MKLDAARATAFYERGRSAHPSITVPRERFDEHLDRAGVGEVAEGEEVFAEDLYLACACSLGDRRALHAFETELLPRLQPFVARVISAPDFVSEVLQTVRMRLLVRTAEREPGIQDYGGRAPLRAWLRVVAIRSARTLAKQNARFVTLPSEPAAPMPGRNAPGPERDFLKEEGADELHRAIERTLAKLDDRGRTILRLYFVEGMSLAALARIYHVHESTMQRRVQGLRDQLLAELKTELDADSVALQSKLDLVASRLDVHLAQHLRPGK